MLSGQVPFPHGAGCRIPRPAEHRNVCGGAHDLRVDPLEEDDFARRHSRACLANSALPPITVGKSLRTGSRKLRADPPESPRRETPDDDTWQGAAARAGRRITDYSR